MAEPYRFPANNTASTATLPEQATVVVQEAKQLVEAMAKGDESEVIFEAYDLIQAAEGILRKCDQKEVFLGWIRTVEKYARRGDYG